LNFSPKANYLCAGSWDNQVRVWEIQNSGATIPKASTAHEAPVLCTSWSGDGSKIFSGGCDNKGKCWSIGTNQSIQIAQHQAPIKSLFWVEEMQCLITGSWDKTVKYWDCRQQNPVHSAQLPDRVYSMDVKFPLCVVGTAERSVVIYDLRKPTVEFRRISSPLKKQTRVVSCLPDKTGFAIASIEGRVGIHHVEDKDSAKNYAFKCHRENNDIYAVNVIAFHPVYGTLATTGSDGTFNFWDIYSRQRLKPFNKCSLPISAGAWNMDGTIFAYGVSYDWSKGCEYFQQGMKNHILLHATPESEIKGRGKGGGRV